MNTESKTQKRNARVSGISFSPETWEYLNEEVKRQGHRNRSLVVERALTVYRTVQEAQRTGVITPAANEEVA